MVRTLFGKTFPHTKDGVLSFAEGVPTTVFRWDFFGWSGMSSLLPAAVMAQVMNTDIQVRLMLVSLILGTHGAGNEVWKGCCGIMVPGRFDRCWEVVVRSRAC